MFETKPVVQIRCRLGAWMNDLTETDRTNLQAWLDSPETTNRIVRLIRDEAHETIGKDVISAHRNGQCRCSAP